MARTRRKHSYRKSKRWNPGKRRGRGRRNPWARPGENAIETVRITRGGRRRNCGGGMRRNPADLVKHLRDGSRVEVSHDGQVEVYDRKGLFSRYEIGGGRLAHFIKAVDRAGKNSDKYSFKGEDLKDEGSYAVKMNPRGRGKRRGRGRARRNPSQFPMPFMSALVNPGRRGRKGRRNPRIKRSEARAMGRVLKRHGYKCSTSSRRSRRSRRGRRR